MDKKWVLGGGPFAFFMVAAGCYTGVEAVPQDPIGEGEETGQAPGEEGEDDGGPGAADTDDAAEPVSAPRPRVVRLDAEGYGASVASLFEGRAADEDAEPTAPAMPTTPFGWINPVDRFSTRAASYRMTDDDFARLVQNADVLALAFVDGVERPECFDTVADWQACHRDGLRGVVELLY